MGWEISEEPLAFYLTWTTYGTWLPGDERGWVAKTGEFQLPDPELKNACEQMLTELPLILDSDQRQIVEETITRHCEIRKWHLHAQNCRTKHIHVVVTAPDRHPDDVMDQFKAWCTRKLKDRDRLRGVQEEQLRQNWWTQRGSKRRLFDEESLEAAILYVLECQDDSTRFEPEKKSKAPTHENPDVSTEGASEA